MLDLFGMVLRELRADAGVSAIVADRVDADETDEGHELQTRVVLEDRGGSRTPIGPGSGRLGLQDINYAAKCYGTKTATGSITARQLAGAVSDALHQRGQRVDSSGRRIARSNAPTIGPLLKDPDTSEPYYVVLVRVIAAAHAAA